MSQIDFTESEKEIYVYFADGLFNSISKFTSSPKFIYNIEEIRKSLEKIVKISSLEPYVQRNNEVILCFVNASFSYKQKNIISSKKLIDFYKMFVNLKDSKKNIVIDSIIARLKNVPVEIQIDPFENLPF